MMTLEMIMSTDLITIAPDDNLATARQLMNENRIHHLPVMDNDELVGLVTLTDVLAATDSFLRDPDNRIHAKEIVAKEMLFSHDDVVIGRIMNDGPFTSGFPRESPGHVGEWIGHRIVSAYLKENPDVSYADLLAMDDPNVILKSYKPR